MSAVIVCENLGKEYRQGPVPVQVVQEINLAIHAGEMIAIVGPSGAGKSTLLSLLGGLDLPSQGRVLINGQDLASVTETQRGHLRNRFLGFVYQFHHLLGEFSALENVAMPLLIRGGSLREAQEQSMDILQRVGLGHRLQHRPGELSGGERQRVAIARALVGKPACVLMDEPTGNLDSETAESIQTLLVELNTTLKTCFVIVTHDRQLADRMSRRLHIRDGRLAEDN